MSFDLILSSIQQHATLSAAECGLLESKLVLRSVRRKELLVKPGNHCYAEHFVNRGCVRNYLLDRSGLEHTLTLAVEGWWTTDIQAFLTGMPATQHVECLENGEVILLYKKDLDWLFNEIPSLNVYFRVLYQNALASDSQRILNVLGLTAEERYDRFIEKYPGLEQRVPQYMIASYLGITREFLSRLKANMVKRRKG